MEPGATATVRVALWAAGRRLLGARRAVPLVAAVRPRSPLTGTLRGELSFRVVLRTVRRP